MRSMGFSPSMAKAASPEGAVTTCTESIAALNRSPRDSRMSGSSSTMRMVGGAGFWGDMAWVRKESLRWFRAGPEATWGAQLGLKTSIENRLNALHGEGDSM